MSDNDVNLGDSIRIGKKRAIVCGIYDNLVNKIEVVYLDERNRATNEDAI